LRFEIIDKKLTLFDEERLSERFVGVGITDLKFSRFRFENKRISIHQKIK